MKKVFLVICYICFSFGLCFGQLRTGSGLPINKSESSLYLLRDLVDYNLQALLQAKLEANPTWNKLIREKKMAVGLVDLRDPECTRYANVNGDEMMYAASLPKIAILLAAMDAIEKGELRETFGVSTDMNLMIRRSDNHASTRMIDRLGYDKIESVLTDPKYRLYDEDLGGGLWVGKRYASSGERHPDPLKGLSHAATVNQVCRYYYLLAHGQLVNYERSKQMLRIMTEPGIHHKFVYTLDRIAPAASLFRKSGSWSTFHADSVLVWGSGWRRYILVALIDDPGGESIIRELPLEVEEVLKSIK